MKMTLRRCAASLCAALGFLSACEAFVRAETPQPSVSAQCAVLITADTGTVLYEKNAHRQAAMASTTKIMTALLTLEEAARSDDPVVEITEEMVAVEGSSMGLQVGDALTLTNLAAGMLLASGNDAANTAALFLDGSEEKFAQRMNDRAGKIGMKDTHFVTPSGLDDDAHYSTAYDMALLAREALKNSEFLRLASSYTHQVEFLEPAKRVSYTNHNRLLQTYEGCIGVKTGYTKKAGRCLVSAAERDGVTLIAVTLDAPDDWDDHTALLDYGFSTVTCVSFDASGFTAQLPLVGADAESVPVRGSASGSICLSAGDAQKITRQVFLPAFYYGPVRAGEEVGRIRYCLDGAEIYCIPIKAEKSVGALQREKTFWEKLFGTKKR